jgi:hypothetical protein
VEEYFAGIVEINELVCAADLAGHGQEVQFDA